MPAAGDATQSSTNVRRLQPLRILLSGRDRRFIRVTSFLLSRRGYDVAQATVSDAAAAAERHRSDIVLLELGDSRVVDGRTIAALQASAASPAVLLVCDDGHGEGWERLTPLYKWTSIENLVEEIEAAALRRVPPAAPGLRSARESDAL
jgi:hypothetical protein